MTFLVYLLILFIPTQFGKHFFFPFSFVEGQQVDYLSPTLYATDIIILFIFALYIFKNKIFSISWVLLFIFLCIEVVLAKSPWLSLYGSIKILEVVFLAVFLSKWITVKRLSNIVTLFSIAMVVESLLSFMQYFHKGSIGGIWYFLGERAFTSSTIGIANASVHGELVLRPYATFPHPNVLAGFLLIGITIITFYLNKNTKKKLKILYITSLILGTASLFLTLSRIAIVLMLIVLILWGLRMKNKNIKKLFYLGVLGFITLIIINIPIVGRFENLSLSDESIVQRQELITASINMIKSHPFFGVGFHNFLPSLPSCYPKPHSIFYLQPVHNIFLLIAAETGLIGFVFFMWLIVGIYKRIKGNKSKINNSKFILLSSVLIIGLFDHYFLTLQQGQLLMGFILGFCLSQESKNKRDTIKADL